MRGTKIILFLLFLFPDHDGIPHVVSQVSMAEEWDIEKGLLEGRYKVVNERFRDIDIYAYFFPEEATLASTYIEYTKKYLELYEGLIGRYPYRRFLIVEGLLPEGYSMPTFTLLGQDVVRLPFIVETSLGYEILHQWFGNLVYIDYKKGNWAEGLTTYLSDHLYEEQKGKGWEYRKKILIDYKSYVASEKEVPLKDFLRRTDFASRAIGYGKRAMLFHMLKNLIADKKFQEASWDDIQQRFEKTSVQELNWFFRQWVDEKGVPLLEIKKTRR